MRLRQIEQPIQIIPDVLASYPLVATPLRAELAALAAQLGAAPEVTGVVVPNAMSALRAGRGDEHDAAVARSAADLARMDVIVLGQFSTARAAAAVGASSGRPVITTPTAAAEALAVRLAQPV